MSGRKGHGAAGSTEQSNSLTIAEGPALTAEDCELILCALDVLDRQAQDGLANKQDAELTEIRSRILIVRGKLQRQAAPDETAARTKGKAKPTTDIATEIRRLQRTLAVLTCIQAAAAEGTDADMGDALSVVLALVEESLAGLDQLQLEEARHDQA